MKTLSAIVLVALALVPAATAAQATDLTGNWNATFTRTAPSGQTQSITFTFHFTQKGKDLSGTIGPEPARQGTQKLEFQGQTAEATVDAERAKAK
jgi:hypothetical protein